MSSQWSADQFSSSAKDGKIGSFNTMGFSHQTAYEIAAEQYQKLLKPRHRKRYGSSATTSKDILIEIKYIEEKFKQKSSRTGLQKLETCLRPIIDFVDQYSSSIDTLVQGGPFASSLIWGCFKLVLKAASNYFSYFEKLLNMFQTISDRLPIYREYETTFRDNPGFQAELAKVYYYILEFLHKTRKTFNKPGFCILARGFWRTFEADFGGSLQNFSNYTKLLREHVQLINTKRIDQIEKDVQLSQKKALMDWVCKADPQQAFTRESSRRAQCSGKWVLDHVVFREWLQDPGCRVLRIVGAPGSGKTVLSTSIIQFFQMKAQLDAATPGVANRGCTSYFYCSQSEQDQDIVSILGSLIKQTLVQLGYVPDLITECYKRSLGSGRSNLSLEDNPKQLLESLCKLFHRVNLVVDGLDEIKDLGEVVKTILSIKESVPNTWILLLSRDTSELGRMLVRYPVVRISEDHVRDDLNSYLTEQFGDLPHYSHELRQKVFMKLSQGTEGMFLWASLMLQTLKTATSEEDALEMVQRMPIGLGDYYESMMKKIVNSPYHLQTLARRALLFMSTSCRPLSPGELSYLLDTSHRHRTAGDKLDLFTSAVLDACQPLVEYVEESDVFRLVHTSVREFLLNRHKSLSRNIHANEVALLEFQETDGHTEFADACLTFLLHLDSCDDEDTKFPPAVYNYAMSFWGFHLVRSRYSPELASKMHEYLSSRPRRCMWIAKQLFGPSTGTGFPLQQLIKMQKRIQEWVSEGRGDTGTEDDTTGRLDWVRDIGEILLGFDKFEENQGKNAPNPYVGQIKRPPTFSYFNKLMIVRDLSREYTMRGWLEEGRKWMSEALRRKQDSCGPDHESTCWLLNSLAIIYDQQGQAPLSAETHEDALRIQEARLGSDHLETIWTVNELGRVYRHLKRYDKAIEMHQRALKVLTKKLSGDDLQLAWTMNTMARAYREGGDPKNGLQYLESGKAIQEKKLGPHHPHVLWTTADIGRCYRDLGNLPRSEDYHRTCLEGRIKVLGPDHPDTLWAMNDLGLVLSESKRKSKLKEARGLHQRALEGQIRLYGNDHRHVQWSKCQIEAIDANINELSHVHQLLSLDFATICGRDSFRHLHHSMNPFQ